MLKMLGGFGRWRGEKRLSLKNGFLNVSCPVQQVGRRWVRSRFLIGRIYVFFNSLVFLVKVFVFRDPKTKTFTENGSEGRTFQMPKDFVTATDAAPANLMD